MLERRSLADRGVSAIGHNDGGARFSVRRRFLPRSFCLPSPPLSASVALPSGFCVAASESASHGRRARRGGGCDGMEEGGTCASVGGSR